MISQGDLSTSARGTALDVLSAAESSHAVELLSNALGRSTLSVKDRQLTTELVQGVLRWRGQLDFYLRRWFQGDFRHAGTQLKNILRLGLYQLLYLDRILSGDEYAPFISFKTTPLNVKGLFGWSSS